MSPIAGVEQYPTEAQLGYTTSLQRGTGDDMATAVFADVGEVTDLTVWDASRDSVEVTNHRSPGFSIESIPGLIDWGSASFEMNFVPAAKITTDLLDDFKAAGNHPWRVVFPEGTTVTFLAALTSYQVTAPVKDVMKGSFELKISGSPEFGATEKEEEKEEVGRAAKSLTPKEPVSA
jgi:predicted secreted protein